MRKNPLGMAFDAITRLETDNPSAVLAAKIGQSPITIQCNAQSQFDIRASAKDRPSCGICVNICADAIRIRRICKSVTST